MRYTSSMRTGWNRSSESKSLATGMIRCPDCGNMLSRSAMSCPHCGATTALAKSKGKSRLIGWLILLILGLGIAIYIILSDMDDLDAIENYHAGQSTYHLMKRGLLK